MSWPMRDLDRIVQGGLGVEAMIFISPLESELMIPGKMEGPLLDDDDLPSNNAWHLKGRGPFKPVGTRL